VLGEEALRELGNVVATLAKWRDVYGDEPACAQPVLSGSKSVESR